ncbi:DUF4240 domain-containing protein [Actomonas aquatica]|uniref:DUF4240 domain-containing protein n=1 Tax=Actomonas aquatica TaxID=2866162 RepID=A0ABZ1C2Y5_9BACT|nr:DUF4240 domain-containing protein [Opitutus sp. WL0086]WRQ86068.1 DUF4240 domain-containing protein [Opitutus sp. WL0086]
MKLSALFRLVVLTGLGLVTSSCSQPIMNPEAATPEEIERGYAAVSLDRFWSVIDQARADAPSIDALPNALRRHVRDWNADELRGFEFHFGDQLQEAYRWDIWGVAYLVNGGASDDGFYYFRAWMVAQGRAAFTAALNDPQTIADYATDDQENELEELLYVVSDLYTQKTGRPPPYKPIDPTAFLPVGERWEEADLPRLFPKVAARFR